jgi:hypothetical protein
VHRPAVTRAGRRLSEPFEEHGAEQGQQDQGDRDLVALELVSNAWVLHDVGGGIRGGQRHRDEEVGGGEAEQDQDEQLSSPKREQPLKHGDRPCAVRALLRHAAIDR